MLASSFILAKTETGLRKIVPSALDNLLTPLFSIFITGILTFTLVGPITRTAEIYYQTGLSGRMIQLGSLAGLFLASLMLRSSLRECIIALLLSKHSY
ncbi:PTS transporter subunit EIIC [Bacillus sp. N9]